MRHVVIVHLAGKQPTLVAPIWQEPTHWVVESYQQRLRAAGHQDGVAYQTYEGDLIGALVAAHRLESLCN